MNGNQGPTTESVADIIRWARQEYDPMSPQAVAEEEAKLAATLKWLLATYGPQFQQVTEPAQTGYPWVRPSEAATPAAAASTPAPMPAPEQPYFDVGKAAEAFAKKKKILGFLDPSPGMRQQELREIENFGFDSGLSPFRQAFAQQWFSSILADQVKRTAEDIEARETRERLRRAMLPMTNPGLIIQLLAGMPVSPSAAVEQPEAQVPSVTPISPHQPMAATAPSVAPPPSPAPLPISGPAGWSDLLMDLAAMAESGALPFAPRAVTPEGIREASAPEEMGVMPGGILSHLPAAKKTEEPLTSEEAAEEVEEAVKIAELPGEEAGFLKRMVDEALAQGREVQVTSPEGTLLPFMKAPPGTYGEGGYLNVQGGPLVLMRQGPGAGQTHADLLARIREDPNLYMRKFESRMTKEKLPPDRVASLRETLAQMLLEIGFDPGLVNVYAQGGLGSKEINEMLSKEFTTEKAFKLDTERRFNFAMLDRLFQREAMKMATGEKKEFALYEAMLPALLLGEVQAGNLNPIVLQGLQGTLPSTTVRTTHQQMEDLLKEAKKLGYRGSAVTLPNGYILTQLFEHKSPLPFGLGGWMISNTKEDRAFRAEIIPLIENGRDLPDDVIHYNMSPRKFYFGGSSGLSPLLGGAAGTGGTKAPSEVEEKAAASADRVIKRMR